MKLTIRVLCVLFALSATGSAQKLTYEEAKARIPSQELPGFWIGSVDELADRWERLQHGTATTIATSPGGHPLHLIAFGEREAVPHKANFNSAVGGKELASYMDKKLRELIRRRVELRKKYKRELGDYLAEIRRRARQASLKTHGELLEKKNDHLRIYLLVQRVGRLTHLLKCLESKQQSDERASAFLDHYTWYLQKAIETGSVVSDKLRKEVQTNMQIARAVLAEKHPPLDKVQVARLEREAFQKALRAKDGHGTK